MSFRPAVSSQITTTTILALVVLFTSAILFLFLQHQFRDRVAVHYTFLISGCFMFFLAIGSFSFRITSYEISSGNLVVHLGFGKKIFPLSGLQNISLEESPFSGARKNAAMAGVWSYCGVFNSAKLGEFHAYATDTSRGVLLTWPDKKVLVTPQDATSFVQSARSAK
jgi:hypothetical protein